MSATDRRFTISIMLFILAILGLGEFHYGYDWSVFRFPILAGFLTCLLCLGSLVRERRGARPPAEAVAPAGGGAAEGPPTRRQTLSAMAWLAAVVPIIFVLGFAIGLPLYVLIYLKAHRQSWIVSAGVSLCTLAVVYLGFVNILGMPPGPFPTGFP